MATATGGDRVNWRVLGATTLLGFVLAAGIIRTVDDPWPVWSGGYTHDGMNGSMWSASSEALRADPIGSRLGAVRHAEGLPEVYVNHPPLIVFETGAAEAVLGERQWVRRLPAWMGTLVAAWLVARLLRREGLGRDVAAVGVLAGFGLPMVFAHGSMLDTPVTSLPFGVWCLLAWQRDRDGDAATWERPLSCALAVMAGWQAALLAVLTLLPSASRSWRAVGGVGLGVALTVGWQAWGAGGLGDLWSVMAKRSGMSESSNVDVWKAVTEQARWLGELTLVAPLVLGAVGLVVWWRRPLARLVAAIVVLYPLATLEGFRNHNYWMFWLVLPVAVGVSALVEERPDLRRGLALIVSAVALASVLAPSQMVKAQDYAVESTLAEHRFG